MITTINLGDISVILITQSVGFETMKLRQNDV